MSSNLLMEIPKCPQHGEQLIHRPSSTPEQAHCGTWYKCPQCDYTVLLPSVELVTDYKTAGKFIFHPNLED